VSAVALAAGDCAAPHDVLGAHAAPGGVTVRAFHPDAVAADCLLADGSVAALEPARPRGLFTGHLAGRTAPLDYRLRFAFRDGARWERDDPYRFLPTIGDLDLHLFGEGRHRRLWDMLGAHTRRFAGVDGVTFAVWAPNARRVSVVGDFNGWDGLLLPMRQMGSSGVYELFVPGVPDGAHYKYEIKTAEGDILLKTDPCAVAMEPPPGTAARVFRSRFEWGDGEWLAARRQSDAPRRPMAVYEVHLGSWARVPEEGNRPLTYRELAPRLVAHARRLGFTHLELLPVMEHPFTGSWGYQVSGYFAPTARYGGPDDLRFFIDYCHRHGVGVLLDWVPGHFPRDAFALARFDGTALYEHADARRGEHPDWGTLIFNYGRNEVRNFLVANALYWLSEFHVDGLRVDAVASMLYLDYSRKAGEWTPNAYGGRENLEAIAFLRELNDVVSTEQPGCVMIAEESTAWPGVTRPTAAGGLGFTFKWNMGWMHDTLEYFRHDPVHRTYHHDQLTFAMVYEHSERYLMPFSHDEVVHGKGSLLAKVPGDPWQQVANLRLLYTYQWTRPGKQLVFMGAELALPTEWNHDRSLDWHLASEPLRAGLLRFFEDLGLLYGGTPALWRGDPDPDGCAWIDCNDRQNSVVSYVRRWQDELRVVVLNCTPVPREAYRIGAPRGGTWRQVFTSDDPAYGGSAFATAAEIAADAQPCHGQAHSLELRLPPLGALVLAPA
jgi:1,4-alpha-glucan branching enzyme